MIQPDQPAGLSLSLRKRIMQPPCQVIVCFDLCSQSKLRTLTVTKRFTVCKRSRIMRVDSLRAWAKTRRIAVNVSRTVSRLQSETPRSPAIIQNCSNMTQIGTQMCRFNFDSYPFWRIDSVLEIQVAVQPLRVYGPKHVPSFCGSMKCHP